MGPVEVASMVQETVGESPGKRVHPFFTKAPPGITPAEETQTSPSNVEFNSSSTQRKRRKTDPPVPEGCIGFKKPRQDQGNENPSDPVALEAANHDSEFKNDHSTEPAASDFPTPPLSDISIRPAVQPHDSASTPDAQPKPEPAASLTPPKSKKVLKWNPKTGTLGSPPKPKKVTPTRIVCIKYGRDDASRKDMGDKISQILEGKVLFPSTPPKSRPSRGSKKQKDASSQAAGSKDTHPFFGGKAKKGRPSTGGTSKDKSSPPPKNSIFMSTPVSPMKSRNPFNVGKAPKFGFKPSGTTKIPGATHPLWPPKDMSHIRGLGPSFSCTAGSSNCDEVPKKSKGSVVTVTPAESILECHCKSLNVDKIKATIPKDNDNFEPAPKELRIPKRHFESGRKLQKRVRTELRTLKASAAHLDQSQDELDNTQRTHPAISRLYDSLETTLSAYDRSTCENQTWAHKYAPASAAHVLQSGKEAVLLREWLQTLRVQSVDTGTTDAGNKSKSKDSAPRKKRKKDKLDGFIIDSDEEAGFLEEISDDDNDWAPAGAGLLKKTVIRGGHSAGKGAKEEKRLTNAVVISGPHGSGKTAAVYAVAKELDFEIFEINSSSRRSGKDILEKVGDMTRNHLVQQHRADATAEGEGEDQASKDAASGKQGMMTSFFKPKPGSVPKKPSKPVEDKQAESNKQANQKNQKQSLILIEEVDILYEEDKQFWATLTTMMAQSKRPFIMTCNDERLVPLDSLNLHAIFRFSTPPASFAVDLCILAAANEGHLLRRSAVESLYTCRNNDLRATLTELNYWCQIGVGDRRGGFDWFVLRWPKGKDLDESGDIIRVASEDTYYDGMGWVSRDPIATCSNPLETQEEAMRQSWDLWRLDMGDWCDSTDLQSWASNTCGAVGDSKQGFATLAAYDDYCDAMSAADFLASGTFGTGLQEALDTTLPEMTPKSREDYTLGRRLVEADPIASPCKPHASFSMSLRALAKHELDRTTSTLVQTGPSSVLKPVDEERAISMLDASFNRIPNQMTRLDIAFAFDPIAISERAALTHLDPSVFDRTLKLIVLDVAPWVRGIVEFDQRLMTERVKLSNLLSEGGKRKRMRTTRSAYSAMEGGERRATRRERYFGDALNTELVRRTAGAEWNEAAVAALPAQETTEDIPSSPPASEEEVNEAS